MSITTERYQLAYQDLILDNPQRKYVLRIHDLPPEDKPREKLINLGPESLTPAELLAVILNTGTVKEDLLSMTGRVVKEYGEQSIMTARDAKSLSQNLDIPLGKAAQIVATSELGRRFFHKNGAATPVIRTAEDVFEYTKDMRNLTKEHLRGLYVNAHYKIIHDETISIGTVDSNLIHPREVFKPALEYAAAGIILVHNHPSGSTEPSDADLTVTNQIIAAGRLLNIQLIDHVIVTNNSFASISANYS